MSSTLTLSTNLLPHSVIGNTPSFEVGIPSSNLGGAANSRFLFDYIQDRTIQSKRKPKMTHAAYQQYSLNPLTPAAERTIARNPGHFDIVKPEGFIPPK